MDSFLASIAGILNRSSSMPLYCQLKEEIAQRIRTGELREGTRLPTMREAARSLGVSLITILQAYSTLAAEGLVHSSPGKGTFVGSNATSIPLNHPSRHKRTQPPAIAWQWTIPPYVRIPRIASMQALLAPVHTPGAISLAWGTPDPSLFPIEMIQRLWGQSIALDNRRLLQYTAPQGDVNLRALVADRLGKFGIVCSPDEVLITSGSQQAIDLVARTFLRPGDYVLVESPTFLTALDIFEASGATPIGVPLDGSGLQVEALGRLVEKYKPRLLYTMPTAHNPTGCIMTVDRRAYLAKLAKQHGLLILEIDSCSEFTYDGSIPRAIKAFDDRGLVIFVKSFSKVVTPGLRVGCVVATGQVLDRLIEAKAVTDGFTSPLLQRTLFRYLSSRRYLKHVRQARDVYRRRRDLTLQALRASMPGAVTWTYPLAGFNLWLSLPDGFSARQAYEYGLMEGVVVAIGDLFLPHPPPPAGIRISFADKSEPMLSEGIARLARALSRLMEQRRGGPKKAEFFVGV